MTKTPLEKDSFIIKCPCGKELNIIRNEQVTFQEGIKQGQKSEQNRILNIIEDFNEDSIWKGSTLLMVLRDRILAKIQQESIK